MRSRLIEQTTSNPPPFAWAEVCAPICTQHTCTMCAPSYIRINTHKKENISPKSLFVAGIRMRWGSMCPREKRQKSSRTQNDVRSCMHGVCDPERGTIAKAVSVQTSGTFPFSALKKITSYMELLNMI